MMTPMIDVVFLLLVFFLATTSFQMIEKMLPSGVSERVQRSQAGSQPTTPDPTADFGDLVVRVQESDASDAGASEVVIFLNDDPIADLDGLKSRLQAIIAIRKDVPVIVDPADTVRIGKAIAVYDVARSSGALRVFFTTR
jgi:biopolymer transport protein ExbD